MAIEVVKDPTRPTYGKLKRDDDERINWLSSTPFFLVHLTPLLIFFTGISRTALILLAVTWFGRMFFLTAGFHRYFSHKTYRLNRAWQFLFGALGTTAAQKGPLWWAAHHRNHHKYADSDRDIHSPRRGFWWSHAGWILCDKYSRTEVEQIPDLVKYPELVWLNQWNWIGPWILAVVCLAIGGWSGLVVGFFCSTILLWHSTFIVNSLAHVMGRRRYDTADTSKNSLIIALLTGGEGWHNNHHRFAKSARQGFRWWQIDTSFYILWFLSKIGIAKELRRVPPQVIAEGRRSKATALTAPR